MSFKRLLRRLLLSLVLGGNAVLGIGVSKEQIEALLYSMNQTRAEVTVADEDESIQNSR
jgi:hypothetical protein